MNIISLERKGPDKKVHKKSSVNILLFALERLISEDVPL